MILSRDEVQSLIAIPKYTNEKGVDLSKDRNLIDIHAGGNSSLTFRLHVTTSKRIDVKLTCHHDHEHVGLIRVDFHGAHKNPETASPDVPDFLNKYIGKRFSTEEHHIHIYVDGFGLNWAIPIADYDFSVKSISNQIDIVHSIREFSRLINLKTPLFFAQRPIGNQKSQDNIKI